MSEPTLQKLLGIGATQTATEIIIKKADLQLTATADNRPDQIAAALVRQMNSCLQKSEWDISVDRNVYSETGTPTSAFRTIGNNSENLNDIPITFHFTLPAIEPVIEPDNY